MTYLAPRQGRFAFILLCSFCLHVLFFVMSAEQSLEKRDKAIAQTFLTQLADEAVVPLSVQDNVSLAVLAERVAADPSVAYVAFFNANDELIVPVGDEVLTTGVRAEIQEGNRLLGKVLIQTTPISRARLLGEYWLFVLTALIIHSLVWLVYGYIARPTKRLQAEIARGVRDKLLAQQLLPQNPPNSTPKPSTPTPSEPKTTSAFSKSTVQSFLRDKLKGDKPTPKSPLPSQNPDGELADGDTSDNATPKTSHVSDTKNMTVQVAFIDKHGLLEMLIEERGQVYFSLCNQMLQKILVVASTHPSFVGVHLAQTATLNEHGTHIYLEKHLPTANLPKASAILTKLIVLVGQVVYDRHRDLGLFALPIKAIASDDTRLLIAQKVLEKHHETLILMNAKDTETVATMMNLTALPSVGVYEKECRSLGAVSDEIAKILIDLRRQVLSVE